SRSARTRARSRRCTSRSSSRTASSCARRAVASPRTTHTGASGTLCLPRARGSPSPRSTCSRRSDERRQALETGPRAAVRALCRARQFAAADARCAGGGGRAGRCDRPSVCAARDGACPRGGPRRRVLALGAPQRRGNAPARAADHGICGGAARRRARAARADGGPARRRARVNAGGYTTSSFDYELPDELIARYPVDVRDSSRLLVLDRATDTLTHRRFADIIDYVEPGDVLVLNETRVIPARLLGRRASGAPAEVLLLQPVAGDDTTWSALVRPGARLRPGTRVTIADDFTVEVLDVLPDGARVVRLLTGPSVREA